jgi:hypothetical protein
VGLAIEVMRQGRVAFARGYGSASLELNVPIRVETVFRVGSITKQFTAAAVLLSVSREDSPRRQAVEIHSESPGRGPGKHSPSLESHIWNTRLWRADPRLTGRRART